MANWYGVLGIPNGDHSKVKEIEQTIDKVVATLWGLTQEELKDIQNSLRDLAK